LLLVLLLPASSCRQDMHDQPKYESLSASDFFADGRSARPAIEGTVARGQLNEDGAYYRGQKGSALVTEFPLPVTRALLTRGRERYEIFCAPCHSRLGDGEGMVVQRGLRHPPSFHLDRMKSASVGHYFDVITNGFGAMAGYASRIPAKDRWAIVAYVRALQLSRSASLNDVPVGERAGLSEVR
jgi:mono/diheme cytochrome c family protein